jgi:zinc transport system substrate-binding protein
MKIKNYKNILFIFAAAFLATVFIFLSNKNFIDKEYKTKEFANEKKLKVVVSFYPLFEFAKRVGGDSIDLVSVAPFGLEPHEFEPSLSQIADVYSSDVFFFNGAGLDPWAEKISVDLKNKGVEVVNMSDMFEILKLEEADDDNHGEKDPHIWLDPFLAQKQVEVIRDVLKKTDPKNEKIYNKNAESFLQELSALKDLYQKDLSSCLIREFITTHYAFNYLAKRYNLKLLSISGVSHEFNPSPNKIVSLIKIAKDKGIEYIFYDSLESINLAETIAKEIGGKTLFLNPVEYLTEQEFLSGKNYISIMKDNLNNLKLALKCQ